MRRITTLWCPLLKHPKTLWLYSWTRRFIPLPSDWSKDSGRWELLGETCKAIGSLIDIHYRSAISKFRSENNKKFLNNKVPQRKRLLFHTTHVRWIGAAEEKSKGYTRNSQKRLTITIWMSQSLCLGPLLPVLMRTLNASDSQDIDET